MRTQYLRSVDRNPVSPGEPFEEDGKVFYRTIANISSLVLSLSDALIDLQSMEVPTLDNQFDFYSEVKRFETSLIRSALRVCGGSQVKAARLLKLNATTLNAKIKSLKLSVR